DDLHAALGNGKGNAGDRTGYAIAVLDQLGMLGIVPGRRVDALRRRGAAAGGIDLQVIVRMALEQIDQTRRQLRAESLDVLRVYAKQRLVAGKGIGMVHARLITGWGTHTYPTGGQYASGVASASRALWQDILP